MLEDKRELNANEEIENEEIRFYNLGPNEVEENNAYIKALEYAMQDKQIRNIAITGKKGSGKSSIIKTYENLYPENKYVNISLASFNNVKQTNNQIERSILEQLLYRVNSNSKKHSRFIRKKNKEIKKINIELDKNIDQGSVFDKYLNEIISYFETTRCNVLVIEDLDRFENSTEIFIKLREINKIINDCQRITRRVRFIYATRDDMFVGEERTKFFDFIIPVVPVITSANSREKLINKLKENDLEYSLDPDYIRDISLYIDDIRIMNNIINEFNIYKQTINISNIIQEKLFSIVLIKNLYPSEFASLQENRGMIFNLFRTKYARLSKLNENISEKELQLLSEEGIAVLIEKFGIENILTKEEIANELITYLIVNEYLDEDYAEYINYFYEGLLKKEDKEFIMAVKTKRERPYNYELTKVKEVLNNLPLKYFEGKYVLNFDLFDYMLENEAQYKEQIRRFFSQMKNNNDDIIEFCTSYIQRGKNVKNFMIEMCKYWQDIWNYFHFNSNEEIKKIYLYNIIKYADKNMIEKINELGLLKEAITEKQGIIKMFETKEEAKSAQNIIELLEIKFDNLNSDDIKSPLGEYIINNNSYNINENTISAILKSKYEITAKDIENKNYSSIIQTQNTSIINYINSNINEYVENILLNENITINDREEDIIQLLNNKEIQTDIKGKIIEKLETKITNIGDIDAKLWKTLIVNNKILPSWNNVIEYYYENEELSKELIEYINLNSKELSKTKIDDADIFAEDVQQEFCDDLIKEGSVTDDIIESLSSFSIDEEILKSNLSDSRIEKMIKEEMIPVEESTYKLVRHNYKELLPNYVALKPAFFVEMQDKLDYDKKDIKGILLNKNTSKDVKTNIIIKLGDKTPCDNEEEATMYYELLSNNKRNEIPIKLFKKMIKYLDEDRGLKLMLSKSNELDEKNITECLKLLGEPYNGITTRAIPKIKKTKLTEELMEMLAEKDISYISSILENKGYYTVYKTRK